MTERRHKWIKITYLQNDIEANLLSELLHREKIPHFIKSYHDTAMDGLFQFTKGWGHIESYEDFQETIMSLYHSLTEADEMGEAHDTTGASLPVSPEEQGGEGDFDSYRRPGRFVDSDNARIIAYARETIGASPHAGSDPSKDPVGSALKLYYRIRDEFMYYPYHINLNPKALKASTLLQKNKGYCIEKANLLAATARALGIPSRLGFAIVQNHIGTERLEKLLRTNKLVFHGYTELFLEGRWVKATPAFDKHLCDKLGVAPLEFDGREDSIFQQYTGGGNKFMEYLHDYGQFADIPYDLMLAEFRKYYPHLFDSDDPHGPTPGHRRLFYFGED